MDHSEVCRAWRTCNRAGRDEAGGCKAGREESAEKSEQMECHRRECGEAVRKRDRSGSTSGDSFGQSVGIFIGPEGGFEEAEVEAAKEIGAVPVTLGRRILRTETAGMTILSILMYHLERE